MVLHLSCGKFFALYIELNITLGATPTLSMEKWNNETVFNAPFAQVIFTPAKVLRAKMEKTDAGRNRTFRAPAAGVAKN